MSLSVRGVMDMLTGVRHYRAQQHKQFLINLKLTLKFKWRTRKYGGLKNKHQSRMRHAIVQTSLNRFPIVELRAKQLIWRIFNTMILGQHFLVLLNKLLFLVTFMQRKFLNRVLYKAAKIQMLENYWDMKLDEIAKQAKENKNK